MFGVKQLATNCCKQFNYGKDALRGIDGTDQSKRCINGPWPMGKAT